MPSSSSRRTSEGRERAVSFEEIAGSWITSMTLSGVRQPRNVSAIKTTADFFSITGLQPLEGRVFDSSAGQPGSDNLAVLDEGFWKREFGGRQDVLGGKLTLDDRSYTSW